MSEYIGVSYGGVHMVWMKEKIEMLQCILFN